MAGFQPPVNGSYPTKTPGLTLRLYDPEIEKRYPWRYYVQFLSPDWAPLLHQEVAHMCLVREKKSYGKVYPMNRASCVFITEGSSTDKLGYGNLPNYQFHQSPYLIQIKKKVESLTEEHFDYCLVHLYRNGRDSIAWHNDKEALNPGTSVVSISLGATRKFRFRPLGQKTRWLVEYHLTSGTMIWMLPSCQSLYEHTVPKELRVKDWRINLTFRQNG